MCWTVSRDVFDVEAASHGTRRPSGLEKAGLYLLAVQLPDAVLPATRVVAGLQDAELALTERTCKYEKRRGQHQGERQRR